MYNDAHGMLLSIKQTTLEHCRIAFLTKFLRMTQGPVVYLLSSQL